MKLTKVSEHVWISPFDDERDLPSLGYVLGEKYALVVDAGHSFRHVNDFYQALEEENLPLPMITCLTHWHWDHSFGLHAVKNLTVAERRTYAHLEEVREDKEYLKNLYQTNEKFQKEFNEQAFIIDLPQMVFDETFDIDLGNLHVHLFHVPSPHTDDNVCVLVEADGVLFVGDCICGVYPTWEIDPIKNNALIDAIKDIDFKMAYGGHWDPFTKEKLLDDLIHLRLR